MSNATYFKKGALAGVDAVAARFDPAYGIGDGDDFVVIPDTTATVGNYGLTTDGSNTFTLLATAAGGVLSMISHSTDNDESTLTRGPVAGLVTCTIGSGKPVAFDCRVKVNEVADLGFFIGLTEEACGADFLADDSGAVADKDYIGFHINTATPTEIDCVYKKAGVTAVEVLGAAGTNAAAFMKLGFKFDGNNILDYYVDDVKVASTTVATGNFPSGEELTFTAAIKTGEGVAKGISLDYWNVAQVGR